MATALAVGDVVRVRYYSRNDVQNAINVRHALVNFIATGGGCTLEDLAYEMSHNLGLRMRQTMGPLATYRGCSVERINNIVTQPVFSTQDAGIGGGTGDMLPPQTAGLINCRTSRPGRKGLGRIYVPFPSEPLNTATGKPSTAYTDALNDLAVILSTQQTFLSVSANTTTRYNFGLCKRDGTEFYVFQQALARTAWSQQRRRSFIRRPDAEPPV